MKLLFHLFTDTYNEKSLSWKSKLKYYSTVIKPEARYAAETLTLNNRRQLGNSKNKKYGTVHY